MIYKNKKQIEGGLRYFLDGSDKIKAITKTRYFNELEKIKGKDKMFNYVLSDLEGKNVEELKGQLKKKIEDTMSFIYRSEEQIVENILKKLKHTHTVLTNENALIPYLSKVAGNVKLVNNVKHEHIDIALVPVDKIDSDGNIFTNKDSMSLIKKANKAEIPVYCYTHSWNLIPKIKGKTIKPGLVKSIISELGIFEPEMFVQELKLNYPWLLK